MGTPRRTNNAMHSPHCQHYEEETENTTKLKLLENKYVTRLDRAPIVEKKERKAVHRENTNKNHPSKEKV